MANSVKPFGFLPVQSRDGSPFSGKIQTYIIESTDTAAYARGMLVKLTGDQALGVDGKYYPVVTAAAAADTKLEGAITGISVIDTVATQYLGHLPSGAKQGNIRVAVPADRNTIYAVQEDSTGGAIAVNSAGANVDFVVGTIDTTTNTAGSVIDSSTVATTNTLPLRIIGLADPLVTDSGNYAIWHVSINLDAASNTTGI